VSKGGEADSLICTIHAVNGIYRLMNEAIISNLHGVNGADAYDFDAGCRESPSGGRNYPF